MKKLWIVTEFYYPMATTTGYYMTQIAEYMSSKGHDVNVICTNARYYATEVFEYKAQEVHNGVKIHRIKVNPIDKNSFFKRTWRMFYTSVLIAKKISSLVKFEDKLLIVTNPAFIISIMPIVSSFKKLNYDTLVHDIFPENLVAIGKLKQNSLANRSLTWWFNKGYSKSRKCISIGRDMSNVLFNKTNNSCPIELIPNWADTHDVCPMKKENTNLYSKYFNDEFVFQFAGNLGHAQGLDNILEAISFYHQEGVKFCFVGAGAKGKTIEEYSKKNNDVVYTGFQERSTQNDFLNACDVSIVTLSDGMYGLGVPSKSYNIMAVGKPILFVGNPNSEIALCVKEYNLGWVVEPNNPQALAKAFVEVYAMRNEIVGWSARIRKIAEEQFSKEVILEKYNKLYSNG